MKIFPKDNSQMISANSDARLASCYSYTNTRGQS